MAVTSLIASYKVARGTRRQYIGYPACIGEPASIRSFTGVVQGAVVGRRTRDRKVGWQVTLCDPIWQVTSRSAEVGFPLRKSYIGLYLLQGDPKSGIPVLILR